MRDDYGDLLMARATQSCKSYYNAKWVFEYILGDLKKGKDSSYSPYIPRNIEMNSTRSHSKNGHLLVSERKGFNIDCRCRSILATLKSKEALDELRLTFSPVEYFSRPQQMISSYEKLKSLEEIEQLLYQQTKTMTPSWLRRRKLNGENLITLIEGIEKTLKRGLKQIHMSLNDLFRKEESEQEQQLLSLIAEIQKKQQEIAGDSLECVVEKTKGLLPVSWTFVKKGFFGETPLFNFKYECQETCDRKIELASTPSLSHETATNLKEEL
jgi:hypothetical protein